MQLIFPDLKGRSVKKRPWNSKEVAAVINFFRLEIKRGASAPGKAKCDECIEKYKEDLKARSWRDIKYYVKNYITKMSRVKNQIL